MNLALMLNSWWIETLKAFARRSHSKPAGINGAEKLSPEEARHIIRSRGYHYRTAAAVLGVNFTHLHRVCTGERHSARLLRAIRTLPRQKGGKAK